MKSGIIGYPRIGETRELKFLIEKYFRKEIDEYALEEGAKKLREKQWKDIQRAGIDDITSNDFSYYDQVLDTVFLFNMIEKRYLELGLSNLDTYFAMARGYQGIKGDVKALAMKKWFNTNYHYIVPVVDENTKLKVNDDKIFRHFKEAKRLGIKTTPTIIGPFTLINLIDFKDSIEKTDIIDDLIACYKEVIANLSDLDATWIQIEEPFLVMDLNKSDIELFEYTYRKLLNSKGKLKIKLQTYFGDIRDCYQNIMALDFDGIGLDFIEGKETCHLIKKNGFPEKTFLYAGIVNGKNVWRTSYEKSINIIRKLKASIQEEYLVVNTSCSLLHVPYTVEDEYDVVKNHPLLAFAKEKLIELQDIVKLCKRDDPQKDIKFALNQQYFKKATELRAMKSDNLAKLLMEEDFIRKPNFKDRRDIQKKTLNLPLLPTTTIGSFPQTKEIRTMRSRYKKGKVSKAEYELFIDNKIESCIKLQEELNLDVLVHGEFERSDMVEFFGEKLAGFIFTKKAWVQSYGTRCVKPPIICDDIKRVEPMTLRETLYANQLTNKPVKGMLTGPVTILNWSFPREDISLEQIAYQIGMAIREEVLDLERHGVSIIQVDEAALKEKLPLRREEWGRDYLDWAIRAFRLVHSGVKPETQIHTHMCYSEFNEIIQHIDAMDADVISFEASRSSMDILEAIEKEEFQTEVGPGIYDIHSPRVPSVSELVSNTLKLLTKVRSEKLWINPDCGLKTRGERETIESLRNLVVARNKVLEIRL